MKKMNFKRSKWIWLGLALVGILFAIFNFVRTGSIILSIATAIFATLRYQAKKTAGFASRRIELVVPLTLSISLFILALSLPHAR